MIEIDSLDRTFPLKDKEVRESGIMPAAAANTIGAPITGLPLTPEKVHAALESQGS